MIIQKIALSLFAIAISSSAFAATSFTEQDVASECCAPNHTVTQIYIDVDSPYAVIRVAHSAEEARTNDIQNMWGYSAKVSSTAPSTADFVKIIISQSIPEHLQLLEGSPVDSPIAEGALKLTAEFKAQENATAISEFNALQKLVVHESDPAVKALIKQAADLKLAGYRK
jgi:glutamyl-tRNA reductase